MANQKSFPHYRVNVRDNSIVDIVRNDVLPVHRPCYVIKAQRGELNKLVWCESMSVAEALYGSETFTEGSTYFSMASLFLKQTLTRNGAFIMRVADDTTAKRSAIILEAIVTDDVDVPQYEVDSDGNRVKARDPETYILGYVPKVDSYDAPITEKGIKIQWRYRVATVDESLDSLEVASATGIYPVMAFEALGVGVYGDNLAFSLFYDPDQNPASTIDRFKSVFYSFEAAEKDLYSSTPTPVRSNYGSILSFASNQDAKDPDTKYSYNMEAVLTRAFDNANKTLPYTIYTYEENIRAIGNLIVEAELNAEVTAAASTKADLTFVTTETYEDYAGITRVGDVFTVAATAEVGSMVNIITGTNVNNLTYNHVIIDHEDEAVNAATLSNKAYIYLAGGNDGDISDEAIELQLTQFFRGNLPADGSIVDKFRYPITHIYDPGYSVALKAEMIEFLEIRDDIMLELSTQVATTDQTTWNTRAEDEINGEFLRAKALLQRESIVMGTDCCRCAIYPQAGILATGSYTGIVPFTLWSAVKHAQYGNRPVMSPQEPRGVPYSLNTLFKSYNWLNFDEAGQARAWDKGLNYCQSADMTRIFYPALRTVYLADSSILTDQWFVDALVYTKHVIRSAWSTHVGRNDPSAVLDGDIIAYLTSELTKLYSGKYNFDAAVITSEEERRLGYIKRVLVRITSPATLRVLEVDVEVNREITEATEEQ